MARATAQRITKRSFGVPLALNMPKPVPPSFEAYARRAIIMGKELAEQSMELSHNSRSAVQAGLRTIQEHGALTPRHADSGLALQSLYWFSACVHLRRHAPERFSMLATQFGAHSQTQLTRALVALSRNDRVRLFHAVNASFPDLHRPWRSDYIGAMAVARLAYGLLRKGITPVVPIIDLDIRNMIDLMCDHPRDPTYAVCFQVRVAQDERTTFTQLLPEMIRKLERQADESPERSLYLGTWNGVCKFSDQYDVNVIPVVARVQLRPWPFQELENCVALFKSIRDFFHP